jgi:hypothetical protein
MSVKFLEEVTMKMIMLLLKKRPAVSKKRN